MQTEIKKNYLLEQIEMDKTEYLVKPIDVFKQFVTEQLEVSFTVVEEISPIFIDLDKKHIIIQMAIINEFLTDFIITNIVKYTDEEKRKINNLLPLLDKNFVNPNVEIGFNNILNLWIQNMTMNVFPTLNELKIIKGESNE